jgi:hypothetical protein
MENFQIIKKAFQLKYNSQKENFHLWVWRENYYKSGKNVSVSIKKSIFSTILKHPIELKKLMNE